MMTITTALQGRTQQKYLGLQNLILAFAGSLLLFLSAKIAVPFYPVPLTMQTFVVIGLGLALGPRLGLAAVALYLAEGALGLPVFAGAATKGAGLASFVGPTGGYLVGFLLASWLAGTLANRGWDRKVGWAFLAAVLSGAIIYVPGLLWLGAVLGWDKPILAWGLYPFIIGDLVKAALAALVFPAAWTFLKNRELV
jgi:biotin transport system substrate-specific component